jgi:tetratricopeptide (TPR) repeat protein
MLLGFSYVSDGRLQEAENAIDEVLRYSHQFGTEIIRTPAYSITGMIAIARGSLTKGIRIIEDAQRENLKSGRKYSYAILEYILGKIYLQISTKARIGFTALKNMGFLVIKAPFATRKAQTHFHRSIELAKEIGAKNILAQAYLDLGVLYGAKGKVQNARECVQQAVRLFERCGAEVYLRIANEALKSLQ